MTVIDTPEGIAFARLLALRSAVKFEVDTGMRMIRGSVVKITNATCGTTFRTKRQCLDHLNGLLAEFDAGRAEVEQT